MQTYSQALSYLFLTFLGSNYRLKYENSENSYQLLENQFLLFCWNILCEFHNTVACSTLYYRAECSNEMTCVVSAIFDVSNVRLAVQAQNLAKYTQIYI